jgi:hypothetical protein
MSLDFYVAANRTHAASSATPEAREKKINRSLNPDNFVGLILK